MKKTKSSLIYLVIFYIPKALFLSGLVISIISTLLVLIVPHMFSKLSTKSVLNLIVHRPIVILLLVASCIFIYLLQGLSSYMIGLSGTKAMMKLQRNLYSRLLHAKLSTIVNMKTGDISSRLTNDISNVSTIITSVIPKLILNLIIIIGSIFFLFKISLILSVSCLAMFLIIAIFIYPINKILETSYFKHREYIGSLNAYITERMSQLILVKTSTGEEEELTKHQYYLHKIIRNYKKVLLFSSLQGSITNILIFIMLMLCIVIAFLEVSNHSLTLTSVLAYIFYVIQLVDPLSELSSLFIELSDFKASKKRLSLIYNISKEDDGGNTLSGTSYDIAFRNVSFEHSSSVILDKVNFFIKQGSRVILVGKSGVGKSTILKLILKLYDEYTGDIFINHKNMKFINGTSIRKSISYVSQENMLFSGTIKENLLYGKNKNVTEERLKYVLKLFGIYDVVSNSDLGLDRNLQDLGNDLSLGQKQRFNLAREFMIDKSVYLLDEVTASLDDYNERIVVNAIKELTEGKTVIMVTHKESIVEDVDLRIKLVGNGKVSIS